MQRINNLVIHRDTCRLCGSKNLSLVVPLAPIPVISPNVGASSDATIAHATAPIDLYLCDDCGLLQLLSILDPAFQYTDFRYRTSVSLGLAEHFRHFAHTCVETLSLPQGTLVIDIGSNDGTLLQFFKHKEYRVLGIDPAVEIAAEASARGIPTLPAFFTSERARAIQAEHGSAHLIVSNNTMANLDNLDDMIIGIKTCLAEEGVYIFETQYALDVLDKTLLDVIYHEHLSYFSVTPLQRFFDGRGFEIIDVTRIAPKGGSIRVTVQHQGGPRRASSSVARLIELEAERRLLDPNTYRGFSDKIAGLRQCIGEAVRDVHESGGIVAGYGSSVGCASLINQFDLGKELEFIVDDIPFKDKLIGPEYELEVVSRDKLMERKPALVIILAWRYAEEIAKKNSSYLESGGRFLIPLPDVSYLGMAG